jgi:hypothetical protein
MIADDKNWENLAAEYLRRLAAEDMREWTRYWKFEDRSAGSETEPQAEASNTLSKRERDRRRLMRVTFQQEYAS